MQVRGAASGDLGMQVRGAAWEDTGTHHTWPLNKFDPHACSFTCLPDASIQPYPSTCIPYTLHLLPTCLL